MVLAHADPEPWIRTLRMKPELPRSEA